MTSSATPTDADVAAPRDDDREDDDAERDASDAPAAPRVRPPLAAYLVGVVAALAVVVPYVLATDDDPALYLGSGTGILILAIGAFLFGEVVLAGYLGVKDGGGLPWWRVHIARLIGIGAIVAGWDFIGWHQRFRLSPPTFFMWLGAVAVVEAVLFLWRAGFVASDEELSAEDAAWWRPVGAADELEREKRSLLKAIKEVEFDREMGKLTDDDAGEIVRVYRARAIEVIKAIDALSAGGAAATSVRDDIERELRARRAVGGAGARAKKKKPGKKEAAS